MLEPAAALASPAAAWPCPGGLSRSMQILCASATPTRGPWQGKHRSAAAAAAVVGRGGDPRQSVGGRELLSVSSPEGLRHRPSFCCEINPHRSPREQRRGRGRPGVCCSQVGTNHPVLHQPLTGAPLLGAWREPALAWGKSPCCQKTVGEQDGPNDGPPAAPGKPQLRAGARLPSAPARIPPQRPDRRFIFPGRLATNLSFICRLPYHRGTGDRPA